MLVGELEGQFRVPSYQRGYRWTPVEVRQLLDDVATSEGVYYLQPIVVKPMGDHYELIDGQQRLTTLFLIMQHIRDFLPLWTVSYSIEYATRPESAAFLLAPSREEAARNIDFAHMFDAAQAIDAWFAAQDDPTHAALTFYTALKERVRVIWYEAPPSVDARTLFIRLNVGRIPLTDAELVKAVLLSNTIRPDEVASQWDNIERDLRDPAVWAFISGEQPRDTHISLLLDALTSSDTHGSVAFHTFEALRPEVESATDAFWLRVVDLHALVMGWYDDQHLFHKIGYLVATGVRFRELVAPAQTMTKHAFASHLDALIRTHLNLSLDQALELSYEDSGSCHRALLLMNVETVRRRGSSERFPFERHVAGSKWTLEHIDAQSAEPLNRAEQWTQWLTDHRKALLATPIQNASAREALVAAIDDALDHLTQDRFRSLEEQVIAMLRSPDESDGEAIDHIGNLALLDAVSNSALSNSCFEVKRQRALDRDRSGDYLPAATRNVFLKYYTDSESLQIHYWGPRDRAAYVGAMLDHLTPYLAGADDQGADERA